MPIKEIDDNSIGELFPEVKIKGDYNHAYKKIDAELRDEQPGQKVWSNPRAYEHNYHPNENYKEYKFRKVPIDTLLNSIDMTTMDNHQDAWSVNGKYDPALFKYDKFKDNNFNNFIRATRDENNKYTVDDGRHRLFALKNDGYTHVVIPIRQVFSDGNPEYNAMLSDTGTKNLPMYIRWC